MLNTVDFVACIRDNLKSRHFAKQRGDAIVKNFENKRDAYISQGLDPTTAGAQAMKDVWNKMSFETAERAKRLAKTMGMQLENKQRVVAGKSVDVKLFTLADLSGKQVGPRGSRGIALASAAKSAIEADPRFTGKNYVSTRNVVRNQLFSMFEDALDKFNKGAFGIQKGKASLPNIVREIKGINTGDQSAKEFAQGWIKVQDLAVDLFNQAGGSMRKLPNYIPQAQSAGRLVKAGFDRWAKVMNETLDWGAMRFPDGSMIKPEDQMGVLQNVYNTITSNGATKIDPAAFRGNGHALGNQLNQHRFLQFKDADSWLRMHDEFGDGTIFDVFARHLTDMAHQISLVDVFGPNPTAGFSNLRAEVLKQAAAEGPRAQADAEGMLKNKVEPMFEAITRQNPMDPESLLGNGVITTSNLLTAAQLGSATLAAAPGDFVQSVAVRALHHMGLFDGIDTYLKAVAFDKPFQHKIMAQSGFVSDEAISSIYGTTRFSGLASQGPAVSRRIADTAMRLNLLQGHTTAARWTMQSELMGLMARSRAVPFQELPFKPFLEASGITSDMWDTLRTQVPTWSPRADTEFLRPIDLLKTNVSDKQQLFQKWQSAIFDFSRTGVPDATVEASVAMKGTTRPDTVPGALLHSFAMYKNFPMSFLMIYGRLAMTIDSAPGRLGFIAGLGAATTLVGAMAVQMREVTQGRDPMPMDNGAFMGKAMLSGGGLGIWGDFLFGGLNQAGASPEEQVAGPLVQFAGDTTQLVLGDAFQWASLAGNLDGKEFKGTTGSRAIKYLERYGPTSSLWMARLALQREVFDRLTELADPRAYQKRKAEARQRQQQYGNGYWWAPGDRAPARAPSFTPGG